jgi:hypothetical protein
MAERGVAPPSEVRAAWNRRIDGVLAEATLERPRGPPHTWFGKRGEHSEHLGYLLAEMQYLQRAIRERAGERGAAPIGLGAKDAARVQAAWRGARRGGGSGNAGAHARRSRHRALREPSNPTGARGGTLAHLYGLPGDRSHRGARAARARGRRTGRPFAVTRARAGLEQRLDHPEGRRKLAAYGIVPPAGASSATPIGPSACPALPLGENRVHQRIRLDAVQGAAPLPRLPGAVRALQVHLTGDRVLSFPSARR